MTFDGLAPDRDEDRSPPALARRIRYMIQAGEVGPGSHLGTVELAERFNVSRGPLREALRLLESAGIVRIIPQRGAFVIALGDREVQEVLSVREVLFALLSERCAEQATPEGIDALGRELLNLEAIARSPSSSGRAFQHATYRFVAQMNVMVGSARLARAIRDLSIGAAELYGHLAVATRDMRLADLKGYQRLYRHIAAKDSSAAFQQARSMHAQGVARANELNASLPDRGGAADGPVLVQRKRRAAGQRT